MSLKGLSKHWGTNRLFHTERYWLSTPDWALSGDVQSKAAETLKHRQSLPVCLSLLPSSHILYMFSINLNIEPTRQGKRNDLSHFPPALRSVARATAAILPCPICLGYTSQAGHKCGMTVREGRQRGWVGERGSESEREREGGETGGRREEGWPRHEESLIISQWLQKKKKQDYPFWHKAVFSYKRPFWSV